MTPARTDLADYYLETIRRADDALAIGIPSVARRILREALIPQATTLPEREDRVSAHEQYACVIASIAVGFLYGAIFISWWPW